MKKTWKKNSIKGTRTTIDGGIGKSVDLMKRLSDYLGY